MELLSDYFQDSNKIDAHNQARQYELKLEKYWVTHDGNFRMFTTVLGMTITDCWNAVRNFSKNEDLENMAIVDYADRLAWDLIYNDESTQETAAFLESDTSSLPSMVAIENTQGGASTISPLSQGSGSSNLSTARSHILIKNPERTMDGGYERPMRRRCDRCGKRTHWMCSHPVCMTKIKTYGSEEYSGLFLCGTPALCFQTHLDEVRGLQT
jgi:hypothetical protein